MSRQSELPAIVEGTSQDLLVYVKSQLTTFFPAVGVVSNDSLSMIDSHLDEALLRTGQCINSVSMWRQGQFSFLHSSQYCQFLYYLANTLWQREHAKELCTRLFLLNKLLNSIDLFYEIQMPEVFFIGHSVGIVLAKASYGNHLVLYQNSTVGKNNGLAPTLSEGVIMYPNSAVIGDCQVGACTTISQGARLVDHHSPGHCLVFPPIGAAPVIKPTRKHYIGEYFRGL
jgi:serine O-acetyltransferase